MSSNKRPTRATKPSNKTPDPPSPMEGVEFADGPSEPPTTEPKGSQVIKKPPPPVKKAKAKEDPRENSDPVPIPERTVASDAANQQAARQSIDKLNARKIEPRELVGPEVVPPDPKVQKQIQPTVYRVTKAGQIVRGAAKYVLPLGKFMSSREYYIESLKHQGIGLEVVKPG